LKTLMLQSASTEQRYVHCPPGPIRLLTPLDEITDAILNQRRRHTADRGDPHPNGFVRSLAGVVRSGLGVHATLDGHLLRLRLTNSGADGTRFTLSANDFVHRLETRHVDAGESDAVPWPTRDGWYDVTVHSSTDPHFAFRFAGRIESTTGHAD
jgi:hypothetical protein